VVVIARGLQRALDALDRYAPTEHYPLRRHRTAWSVLVTVAEAVADERVPLEEVQQVLALDGRLIERALGGARTKTGQVHNSGRYFVGSMARIFRARGLVWPHGRSAGRGRSKTPQEIRANLERLAKEDHPETEGPPGNGRTTPSGNGKTLAAKTLAATLVPPP
jgi:hypothetical protein